MGVYWECWELRTNYGGQREQRKPRAGVGVSHNKRLLHFFPVISYGGLAQPERPSVTGSQS